jgi:phage tail-like protein
MSSYKDHGVFYPMTKMNFVVTVSGLTDATAAFNEVTGVEASVDVVEFRQGNSNSLAPIKIPGLVKHGNVTLKMGYTIGNGFKKWVQDCVSETRGEMARKDVTIEPLDIRGGAPQSAYEAQKGETYWILKDAWVTKYSGADLNASASEVAIETVELAYEELVIPS